MSVDPAAGHGETHEGVPPATDAVTAAAAAVAGVRGGHTLRLWASCPGGCEQEAAAELAALGWRPLAVPTPASAQTGQAAGLRWERGSVYGVADVAAVEATLRAARTITRLTWLIGTATVDSLAEVAEAVRAAPLPSLPDAPFAVAPERHGSHAFRSPDIGREAGAAVIARHHARTGRRLPVDLNAPTTVVRVELVDDRLRIGCELSDGSLHRREYLPRRHRAGLSPVLAAVLVAMSGWRPDGSLLDPMCGAGTILVEAARAARRWAPRPPGAHRLEPLGLRRPDLAAAVDARVTAAARHASPTVLGRDRFGLHVHQTRVNARAAGVADAVDVRQGDAAVLAGLSTVDCVATNPPWGVRAGSRRVVRELYPAALARLAELLPPGGRVVWFSADAGWSVRAAADAGLRLVGRRGIGLGSFDAVACRFERPDAASPDD